MNEQPQGSSFSTLALHAGGQPNATDPTLLGWAVPGQDALDQTAARLGLPILGEIDPRIVDPTNAVLEERIATLEGGTAALAVASGRAALLILFHTLLQPGDEFVAARGLGRDVLDQFAFAFPAFGWQAKWADADRPESFVEALSDRTKAIFIPSLADAGGTVTDIEAIANVARRARVPLVVDNTLATPYLLRPLEHGADVVVQDAAVLLSGHAQAMGGLIVDGGTFEWLKDARYPALSKPQPRYGDTIIAETFGNFALATACRVLGLRDLGPVLSPAEALIVLHGIETLELRMQRQCDSAHAIAEHLSQHPAVTWVRYAGLGSDPSHGLARRYCPKGAGTAFGFGLAGGRDAGIALMSRVRLVSREAVAGGARSFAQHPASSRRYKLSEDRKIAGPDLIHLSIGLEDTADIIADLDRALTR